MKKSIAKGFTLIELLVTITVASILLGLTVPSFVSTINTNRVATSTNQLITAVSYTRSEAVKRTTPVAICPANSTFTACVDSTDWSTTGWIAFTDDGATVGAVDATEKVIQSWPPLAGLTATSGVKFIRYLRDGSRDGGATWQADELGR